MLYLKVEGEETILKLHKERTIGRDAECNLTLPDPKVSRLNTRIYPRGDHCIVRDMGSDNGTFVNGIQILEPVPVRAGDRIRIGSYTLLICDEKEVVLPPQNPLKRLLRILFRMSD
jgi:pSer/pThr/pTyr-binding forkhead associated (FHA) protein